MKKNIALFLSLFSSFIFAQAEQISLDFFAENLLPQIDKVKIFYDGKIIEKTDYQKQNAEETIIENVIWDYSLQGKDRRGISNKDLDFFKSLNFSEIQEFANVKNSIYKSLKIPKLIRYRSTLNVKKRKSGTLRYKVNQLFPQKYNLKVSTSIQITENSYLTRIYLNKQDFEKGIFFDIIVKGNKVVDWTETSWIQ